MINFELDEDQQLIRDTVVELRARRDPSARARGRREGRRSRPTLVQKGWELGLVQSVIPEEHGGFGNAHSAITGAVVAEELAYGDLSIALHLLAPRLVTVPGARARHRRRRSKQRAAAFCGERFEAGSAAVMEPRMDFDATTPATVAASATATTTC